MESCFSYTLAHTTSTRVVFLLVCGQNLCPSIWIDKKHKKLRIGSDTCMVLHTLYFLELRNPTKLRVTIEQVLEQLEISAQLLFPPK